LNDLFNMAGLNLPTYLKGQPTEDVKVEEKPREDLASEN